MENPFGMILAGELVKLPFFPCSIISNHSELGHSILPLPYAFACYVIIFLNLLFSTIITVKYVKGQRIFLLVPLLW